ncbi:MAG: helix-turn-helix domain-containing protein [Robiginitomaculum sp.]|nr:helix-turn-helix domain-containing protein [Robiginitomaculum sp.]
MIDNPDELVRRGWNKEKIKTELRLKGFTLASLARIHGKGRTYFSIVLIQSLPKGEKVIADILGVHPSEIWPARYGSVGRPHVGRFLPRNDGLAKQAARQALKNAS